MFDQKAYMREYARRQAANRRKAGLCVVCCKPSEGKSRCAACRKKDAQRINERSQRRMAAGLCKKCGKEKPTGDHVYCDRCLEIANCSTRKSTAKRRREGRCLTCGIPCENARCPGCEVRSREATRATRKKWTDAGMCLMCGKEAIPNARTLRGADRSQYCSVCYLKMMAGSVLGSGKKWRVLLEKLDSCGWKCFYTGEHLVMGDNLSFDHMDPVCRFPETRHDPRNIVPCSWQANLMKRDLTRQEFLEMAKLVYLHNKRD